MNGNHRIGFQRTALGFAGMLQRMLQVVAGQRLLGCFNIFHRALRNQLTAASTGARSDIDYMVGTANRFLIMLYYQQRVAFGGELFERRQQNLVVTRMQTDGRFV